MEQLEQRISSREVAEMMEMNHKELLRKIDGINEVLSAQNCANEKYWTESTYEYNGRKLREFNVSKRGCEFLANKSTGEKGIIFTDRYMDRFAEMETKLSTLQDSYMISDPIERAKRWIEEQEEKKQLELEVKVKDQQINELQPKATYYDLVLQSNTVIPISVIAKDYGMGAPTMNTKLWQLGVQYKQGDIWLLYSKYQDKGYTQTKTHTHQRKDGTPEATTHTYWTQKGRLFIYDLLKSNGILPLIERKND